MHQLSGHALPVLQHLDFESKELHLCTEELLQLVNKRAFQGGQP
jgi:hypothetical protein